MTLMLTKLGLTAAEMSRLPKPGYSGQACVRVEIQIRNLCYHYSSSSSLSPMTISGTTNSSSSLSSAVA